MMRYFTTDLQCLINIAHSIQFHFKHEQQSQLSILLKILLKI